MNGSHSKCIGLYNSLYYCTRWWFTAVVAKLKEEIKTMFSIPTESEIRLWNNYLNNTYECLARLKDENTLQDAGFYSGNTVIAETKKEDGSWQREDNNTKSSVTFHPITCLSVTWTVMLCSS